MIRPSEIGRGSALINGAGWNVFSTPLQRKSNADGWLRPVTKGFERDNLTKT
jgi:hypothetical protein